MVFEFTLHFLILKSNIILLFFVQLSLLKCEQISGFLLGVSLDHYLGVEQFVTAWVSAFIE